MFANTHDILTEMFASGGSHVLLVPRLLHPWGCCCATVQCLSNHIPCLSNHIPCLSNHHPCPLNHPPCLLNHPSCLPNYPPCLLSHPPRLLNHPSCLPNHPTCLLNHPPHLSDHPPCLSNICSPPPVIRLTYFITGVKTPKPRLGLLHLVAHLALRIYGFLGVYDGMGIPEL